MKPQGFVPASAPPTDHEGADLKAPLIVRTGIILGAGLVVLLIAAGLFFHYLNHIYVRRTSQAMPLVTASDLPPAPRLQIDPAADLQAVRDREDAHLGRYAWVDRAHGVAQIPIDRAMALWVKTYAPSPAGESAPATNAPPASTELQMRQDKAKELPHAP